MEPTFFNGNIVELESNEYSDGDVVIAIHQNKLVIKRLISGVLIGDNREVTAIYQEKDVDIIGKVILKAKDSTSDNAHYSKVWAAERLFTFHDTSGGIDEAYIERGDDGYPRLKAKAKAKDSWFLKNIHCRGIDSMGLTGKKGNDNTYPNPSNMITLESHSITRYSSYVMLNWVFKLKSSSFATYFRSPYTLMYDLRLTFNYTVGGDSERMTYYIEDIWDLHGVIDESWWNTPPTTPGAFSAPTASSNLQGGTTYTVNWDASSDSEGDTVKYYLEFYDGSSWTTIASNLNSTNYNWTVPINVGAINNAQLRVKAKDPGGSGSYSSYQSSNSFSIYQNTDPTISLSTSNNQTLSEAPDPVEYTVGDADGDTMTITERIEGRVIRAFQASPGTAHTLTVSQLEWIKTRLDTPIEISVEADDGQGGVTVESFTVTRIETAIDFSLKNPFVTDVAARRILLTFDGVIPTGAIINIEACNNAFDALPTWENITNMVRQGFPYPFTNETKTATDWGVSFRVRIERGTETGEIYLDGIGGAFD